MTSQDVIATYEAELARLTAAGDADALRWACKGTRTRVHEALQAATPHPTAEGLASIDAAVLAGLPASVAAVLTAASDDGLHHLQTAHFSGLWKQADAIVAAAGITEAGRV